MMLLLLTTGDESSLEPSLEPVNSLVKQSERGTVTLRPPGPKVTSIAFRNGFSSMSSLLDITNDNLHLRAITNES